MFGEKSKCYVTKIILFSLLVCLSVFFAFVNFVSPDPLLEKGSYNFAALGIICFVFEILLEESVLKKIKASTTSILIKTLSKDQATYLQQCSSILEECQGISILYHVSCTLKL